MDRYNKLKMDLLDRLEDLDRKIRNEEELVSTTLLLLMAKRAEVARILGQMTNKKAEKPKHHLRIVS